MIGPFWELWQRTYFVKLAIAFTTCCPKNSLQKSLLFSLFKTLWNNIHGLSLLFGVFEDILKCSECGAAMTSHIGMKKRMVIPVTLFYSVKVWVGVLFQYVKETRSSIRS